MAIFDDTYTPRHDEPRQASRDCSNPEPVRCAGHHAGGAAGSPSPEETGASFAQNARLKALAYAAHTGLVTVAEDSGLEIPSLGNVPGIHSARFLGDDASYAVRFQEISRRLAAASHRSRDARFVAAVAVAHGEVILFETEASVEGEIAAAPTGAGGFGYDPLFFYPPFGKTTAGCSTEEKAAISHRARAFRDLARWLREAVHGPV